MFRKPLLLLTLLLAVPSAPALERELGLGFNDAQLGQVPSKFRPLLTGQGRPGQWEIVAVDAPSAFPSVTGKGPTTSRQNVLAQISRDPTDERFPLLVYEEESFGDFTFTAQVRMVGGGAEQMAGLAFRIQDEKNYYVIRANALNGNFRFYKFVNGERSNPIGPEIAIPRGEWIEIGVQCQGNELRFRLNGKEAMPPIIDTSFTSGKIGFWTKSDSESQFANAMIRFKPREALAVTLVRDALKKYDRLRGLKLFSTTSNNPQLRVLAADQPEHVGKAGGDPEAECFKSGKTFFAKSRTGKLVTLLVPLKDRNGDIAGVLEVTMDTFFGQTEANALTRAMNVARYLEPRIQTKADLVE
jgi:hypothetical protein